MLLANYGQTALITQPHNVMGATRTGQEYRDFTLSLFGAQIALSAALGVSAALIALAVAQSSLPNVALVIGAGSLALPLWQLQEFARRVLLYGGQAVRRRLQTTSSPTADRRRSHSVDDRGHTVASPRFVNPRAYIRSRSGSGSPSDQTEPRGRASAACCRDGEPGVRQVARRLVRSAAGSRPRVTSTSQLRC